MAKAFDTLSHGYLREVFKFVNFGPNFINWLRLLGENCTACILLDSGEYSRPFDLGRGKAQGDNISPNTFNSRHVTNDQINRGQIAKKSCFFAILLFFYQQSYRISRIHKKSNIRKFLLAHVTHRKI
jgi:hypothetical protein